VTSRPALSQDEAILLLATGYTREELEREGIGQAAFEKLASFLGEQLVSRFSGPRDPDERTFLDRFRFTVGKDVSRSGDDTIEAEFEASDKLFLRVERDRFDEYNGGVVWRIRRWLLIGRRCRPKRPNRSIGSEGRWPNSPTPGLRIRLDCVNFGCGV